MISPSMGHRQYGTDSEDEYGAPNLQQGPEFENLKIKMKDYTNWMSRKRNRKFLGTQF